MPRRRVTVAVLLALGALVGLAIASALAVAPFVEAYHHARAARPDEVSFERGLLVTRGHAAALVEAHAWSAILPRARTEPDDVILFRALVVAIAIDEEEDVPPEAMAVLVRCATARRPLRSYALVALVRRRDPRTLEGLVEAESIDSLASLGAAEIIAAIDGRSWHKRYGGAPDARARWLADNREKLPPQIR